MLVGKDGDRAAYAAESFHDLLEEFVARVEFLAFLVGWVVTVLADKEHRVDNEAIASVGDSVVNGLGHAESVFFGQPAAKVVGRNLMSVHGHDAGARLDGNVVRTIALEDATANN